MEKTKQVMNALRNKYDDGANAFLEQVGNATGWNCNRHADALVICLWESRKYEITGFEVKVSRQDWLKELKHPEKADPIAKYCNSWYLVLGDANLIQFGEIPMGWGLMVPHTKNSLKIVKKAERNLKPKPVDLPFMCAILRRATQQLTEKAKLQTKYNKGYDDGLSEGKEQTDYLRESKNDQLDTLKGKIKEFEGASGVNIDDWHNKPSKIGDAVKIVLDGSYIKQLEQLEWLHRRAENCAKAIGEEIQKHKEVDRKSP